LQFLKHKLNTCSPSQKSWSNEWAMWENILSNVFSNLKYTTPKIRNCREIASCKVENKNLKTK